MHWNLTITKCDLAIVRYETVSVSLQKRTYSSLGKISLVKAKFNAFMICWDSEML